MWKIQLTRSNRHSSSVRRRISHTIVLGTIILVMPQNASLLAGPLTPPAPAALSIIPIVEPGNPVAFPPGAELNAFKIITLLPLDESSSIEAINTAGDVAGRGGEEMAKEFFFIYRQGHAEKLNLGVGTIFYIGALSTNGTMIGRIKGDMAPQMTACVLSGGKLKELEGVEYPTGINSFGLICGVSQPAGYRDSAVVYVDGEAEHLTNGKGEFESSASALNDAGEVVETVTDRQKQTRAFISQLGKIQILGTLGGPKSYATAISTSGLVVGDSDVDDKQSHAFLFDGTKMTDLGTLGGPDSSAKAVNDSGQVVGSCVTGKLNVNRKSTPFLYDHGKMKDLNSLLQDKDWTVYSVSGITNSGQIAANATYKGKVHAVILSPVAAQG